jgi:hypothetical protein
VAHCRVSLEPADHERREHRERSGERLGDRLKV